MHVKKIVTLEYDIVLMRSKPEKKNKKVCFDTILKP